MEVCSSCGMFFPKSSPKGKDCRVKCEDAKQKGAETDLCPKSCVWGGLKKSTPYEPKAKPKK